MYKVPPIKNRFKKGISGNPRGRPIIPERLLSQITMAFLILVLKAYKKDKATQKTLVNIKKYLELENYG